MVEKALRSLVFLLLGVASMFIIGAGIKASASILNPILLAAVITVVVLPAPQYLTQKGLPSWLSFVITLLLVVGSLLMVIGMVFFSFSSLASNFSNQVSSLNGLSSLPASSTLGLQSAAIILVGYVLINVSVQNFIQPSMMGQGLGISPVVVFISLFVWGWLLGGIGAILAVPLTMIIMALLNTKFIATLMSTPRSDKKDDHKAANDKLKDFWQKTKHSKLTIRAGKATLLNMKPLSTLFLIACS